MTTDQVLFGVGLILVLAVGSQVLASRLRIPALIILLPAGFIAGALTSDVNPQRLLGAAFQPLVSLAVAVILYDAGLALDLGKLRGHTRRVVRRLIIRGVPVTWAFGARVRRPAAGHVGTGAALMLGAILVVSGPTVVGPLLRFIRPDRAPPAGTGLGRIADRPGRRHPGRGRVPRRAGLQPRGSPLPGGAVPHLGRHRRRRGGDRHRAAVVCLRKLDLGEVLGTTTQLAAVVGVAAVCDIARDDAGLIAAILMGLALANMRGFGIPARRPFFETLVQLIIGVLFISISATVTPASLEHLVLPTLGLVAVLVLVTRPLVAFLATIRTDLTRGERRFTGWMAPRGIVAAATASTFGTQLAAHHVGGAAKILPVTFLVIVATVAIYGLTAVPVARRLHVTRPARTRPLLVGGDPWVIDLARALRSAGLDVLDVGRAPTRNASRSGRQAWNSCPANSSPRPPRRAPNSKASPPSSCSPTRTTSTPSPPPSSRATPRPASTAWPPAIPTHGVVAPFSAGDTVFAPALTRARRQRPLQLRRPHHHPARQRRIPPGTDLLFLITPEGTLHPATTSRPPAPQPGDTLVLLGPDERGRSSQAGRSEAGER